NALTFSDGVLVNFQRVAAIFELIADLQGFGGQLSRFADRNESRVQPVGESWTEDKSPSLHAEHQVNLLADVVCRERVNQPREADLVLEERGDVVEEDAFFREVGHLTDQLLQPLAIYWLGRHLGRHLGLHFRVKLLEPEMN